jgi:hypothetical protein
MGTVAIKSLGLLAAGAGLGLGVGAWLWRANDQELGSAGTRQGVAVVTGKRDEIKRNNGSVVPLEQGAVENSPDRRVRLARVAELFKRSDGRNAEKMQEISEVLSGLFDLSGDDYPRLFELIDSGEKLDEDKCVLILLRWAGENPKAALAFALERKEFKESERVISALMFQLAKVDVRDAKAALSRFPAESEELRDARRGIVNAILQKNPKEALEYAREIKDPNAVESVLTEWASTAPLLAAAELDHADPGQRNALEAIGNSLLAQDRAAFEAWSAGLTDAGARMTVRRLALTSESITDPAKAAMETTAWLKSDPAVAGAVGDGLPTNIVQRWWETKAAPAVIAGWAADLPAGKEQDAAVAHVAMRWVEQDALAASGWIDGLPPGDGRDRAVNRLVKAIVQETPADAFVWARTVQNYSLRGPLLRSAIKGWAAVDPAAAMAAVESLPEEQRGGLREIINRAQAE